jgi:hypothetical protein
MALSNHKFTNYHNVKSSIFWGIMLCSPLKIDRRFGGTYRLFLQGRRISQRGNQNVVNVALLATCFTLLSCLSYSSTLKMEALCSSETSIEFQRTTWRYIREERTLYNHRCENLNSCYGVGLGFIFLAVVLRSSFSLETL